ncbi:hypothetical protein M9Y10_031407 [Tritrichomonas musculus]|uniref:DUF3447 domain-containing protein n=1 Tax=Tritrichomonas musculus TaxID=1915356 RepID=A0ABR2H1G4_9EUKA
MEAEAFLSQNKENYEIIEHFQDLINNISSETFAETIKYVEDHKDIFFKNRESAILFLWNIRIFTIYNFTKLEIILDICIHFWSHIKQQNIKEDEIIDHMACMRPNVYYLYSKNLFSLDTIIGKSVINESLFAYFYPEIDNYDHEYAEKRKKNILSNSSNKLLKDFLQYVILNQEEHKKNREKHFNPLPLHKAIRDDDIELFQSILSKNNYDIDYLFNYSYYERTLTEDSTPSLIKIAAVYGSIKIFKFLWMQPTIVIDDNLICYAISGRNYEIIHICEEKCSDKRALMFSINSNQHELTDYFIDNIFSENIQKNEFNEEEEEEDNMYNKLDPSLLLVALESANYHILLPCLKKIVSIISIDTNANDFLQALNFDFNLFKFLFSHKSNGIQGLNFSNWVFFGMTDVINYILKDLEIIEILQLLNDASCFNPRFFFLIFYFLKINGLISENGQYKNNDYFTDIGLDENQINETFHDDMIQFLPHFYNADLIEKISSYLTITKQKAFLNSLIEETSTKFINSLFKRKLRFSSDSNEMYQLLKEKKLDEAAEYLLNNK